MDQNSGEIDEATGEIKQGGSNTASVAVGNPPVGSPADPQAPQEEPTAGKVSGLGEEMKAIRAIDGWLEKFDRPGAERVIRFVLEHRGGQVTFGNR